MDPKMDHYKLLGVEATASEAAIRQAYKKKALEWHPDKRSNDVHAERMFKEIKKAYETLSNDLNKLEYDAQRDDNDDDTILLDMFQLSLGKRPSQVYEDKVRGWIAEFPRQTFFDNVDTVMESINKTILEKYQDDYNVLSAPLTLCSICSEQCQDLTDHFELNRKKYMRTLEKMSGPNPSLNEQLASLAPDDWSWKPIDLPVPIFEQLWLSAKWADVPRLIDELSPALLILRDSNLSSIKVNSEIAKIVKICFDIRPVNYLPDISSLITTIDDENSSRSPGQMRTVSEDNEYRSSTGSRLSIAKDNEPSSPLAQLYYVVKPPPITMTNDSTCSDCKKSLSRFLLRGRYHCRMCGQTQCSDCQRWQTCRHLGYTLPVRICQACSLRKKEILAHAIHSHVQLSITNRSTQYLSLYVALLQHYSPQNDSFYEFVGNHFLVDLDFAGVLQCFSYRRTSRKPWLKLAETACSAGAFAHAFTCFDTVSQQFRYSHEEWTKKGDDYCDKGNAVLALFSYRQAKLSHEQVWLKSVLKLDKILITLYTISLARQSNQFDTWVKQIAGYLLDKNFHASAILTLQLTQLNASQWALILDDLGSRRRFMSITTVLKTVSKSLLNDIISKSTNSFVQLTCLSLSNNSTAVLDSLMILPQVNMEKLLIGLVIVHILQQPDWLAVQSQYCSAHEFGKVLICHKFRCNAQLCHDDDLHWADTALKANEPFAYLIKSLTTTCSYMQLAEAYACESDQSEIALNYYMLTLNKSSTLSTALAVVQSTTKYLTASQALRCHLAMYRQMKSDRIVLPHLLETIYNDFQKKGKPILNLLLKCILMLDSMDVLNFSFHSKLLEELSKQYEQNFETIDAALHFLSNKTSPTGKSNVHDLTDRHREAISSVAYTELKSAVYKSIAQLVVSLSTATNVSALERIHREYFGNRNMATAPGDYRAKMYLIEGVIAKLQGHYFDAAGKLHQAMICLPSEEMATTLVMLMSDSTFHQALMHELLSAISILLTSGRKSVLASTIHPPPTTFATENHLIASVSLNLVRKYERAILKRLNQDSLQSALSYIDMCQAVHDPTCLVSNWTLACMYFFDLLVKMNSSPGQEAYVYAYRNMIDELACQSFALSRHFLPPHMQTYIFRLLLTLLVEANKIFRSSINCSRSRSGNMVPVVSERQSQVITQMLNFTVHLTKVSPFIQLPTSLSYDLLYLEALGQRFLVTFLEAMVDHSHLYQYYLFEGVWNGWASTQNFEKIRLNCMEALLAEKGWNLLDVQILLDIPLIPRTNDGWLYRERRQLSFASRHQFSKVDGISFDTNSGQVQFSFQPTARHHENALFDSNDVAEVFKRGLTSCVFTLNQPDNDFHAHPFQEMLYAPPSLLYTQYCATLLHTDYLLKMFTTGTEVSAKPPFQMRSISESFFQRLPAHLHDKLKPLHDRERNMSLGRAHRFWIEADEFVYEQKLLGTQLVFRVADVKLRVRKHLLIRDSDGKLIDDDEADESEEEKRSAESQFAKAFTDHYDEIGSYFPELLRLKELLKLSALYVFARSRYEHLKEPVDAYSIETNLTDLRRKIDYPQATTATVETHYNDVLSKNGISSWKVSSDEASSARSMIRSQLEEVDRQIIDEFVSDICEQAHTSVSNVARSCVEGWLDGRHNGSERLAGFIASGVTTRNHGLMRPIEQLQIRARDDRDQYESLKHADNTCNWVPAVFLNKTGSGMRIYGGVNLQLKLTTGQVPPNNLASAYSATNILASQTITSSTGPRNKQEYQTTKRNLAGAFARDSELSGGASSGSKGNGGNRPNGGGASSGYGNGDKPPPDRRRYTPEEPEKRPTTFGGGQSTDSRTRREALKNALEHNGIPKNAQRTTHWSVPDMNPEMEQRGREQAKTTGRLYAPPTVPIFRYQFAGRIVELRQDTARSYNERRPKGSTNTNGAQRSHFNVYVGTTTSNMQDTGQHHFFDEH